MRARRRGSGLYSTCRVGGICCRIGFTLPLLLSLCGCVPTPFDSNSSPPTVLIDSVPFVAQDANACGPASLAMVLQYNGHAQHQDQLKPLLMLPARDGTLQVELMAAARREGMLALPGPTTLKGLLENVVHGFPVIVLQNLRLGFWPQWHYAVVIGFDEARSQILLRSGNNALIETPYSTFENTWRRGQHWSMVVVPPTQLPPGVSVTVFTTATEALAFSGHPSSALSSYATASKQWPQEISVWNGMANLAYTQKRWRISQQAFAQSLWLDTTQARTWNNFAYALRQTGCHVQSNTALTCALQLAPNDPLLQDSAEELAAIKTTQTQECPIIVTGQCKIDTSHSAPPDIKMQ